ncbi:DNA mismatch repair protein MutL [Caldicellulosiruptor bescii]|uniref:DNA mismatch repair protein MutL n=2 Tax=Caldicellulosiruptor bescii TaxID=31899 RepID=B9MJT9_CALBD|nr:DNA mismatch repair endonuclease MutL [Caldicellulosiruptor bescii]ACM60597.1 DNA mismatch repair protein MutL [Caldicellulosiruptor bescii DSM 6725]PBC88008.1 DNA mismatch repair protein MutL [Caldicellulosiruptor bescii]PBC90940.1 DNA mismatch repair protein MutL [Caldicellulosiruptor bescii]PBD03628.1 DNA mismatch repair protein MutL [Caldicellulosiruptor bescii]PBD06738.1 DNA mismatch repair protein MutL [Caldicellulosiruptor bescii]
MRELYKLPEQLTHILAAGEVVERPASCLKELLENSIDAGANLIDVKIEKGGMKRIEVYDNGKGIHPDDIEYVFERHTTSKIKSFEDIFSIKTMGFRGEALCAISSVSKVTLVSKHLEEEQGCMVKVEGGKVLSKSFCPFKEGTRIVVEDIFYNTPARLKFLKSPTTEQKYCLEVVEKIAIAWPEISFRAEADGKRQIFTPGDNKIESAIGSIFGIEIVKNLVEFSLEKESLKVWGYFVNPTVSRATRSGYHFYVNRRYIKSKLLSSCIDEAFKNSVITGRFPIVFLFIQIPPSEIDVNVHPSKLEIKFRDERFVYNTIYKAITDSLKSEKMIPKADLSKANVGNDAVAERKQTGVLSDNLKNDISLVISEQPNFFGMFSRSEEIVIEQQGFENFDAGNYKIVGYAFDTYIIVQGDDSLYLIDQHAVHERRLFEDFKSQIYSSNVQSQVLVSPVIVQIPSSRKEFVISNRAIFQKMGFEIEDFGKNEILVRTWPAILTENIEKMFLIDIIEMIYEQMVEDKSLVGISEDLLKRIACRAAVKGNSKISDLEKKEIVELVLIKKEIFHCPHGRPVVVEISKREIEKMFKRIV